MNAESREAYIAGAREAFDYAYVFMLPSEAQALREWMEGHLAEWTEGLPPPGPARWLDDEPNH